jgi:hypothetical protein
MTNGLTRRAALLTSLAFVPLVAGSARRNLKVAISSKHLQFIPNAELANTAADSDSMALTSQCAPVVA